MANSLQKIQNEKEYQAALFRIDALMNAKPGSPEEVEIEALAALVEAYEDEHYPIPLPDPVEALGFRMEQMGLTEKT